MADDPFDPITLRHPATLREVVVTRGAAPFFVNQGYEVLDSRGNVSGSATAAASTRKEN